MNAASLPGLTIRQERVDDIPAIELITRQAFANHPHSQQTEHLIVAALRAADRLTLSLVAVRAAEVVGHVAFSPVNLSSGASGWFGLGPVSVAPKSQRKGVGTALIRCGLEHLQALGASGCVVLGDPVYYQRFGFACHEGLRLPGVPPGYFQALIWHGDPPDAEVTYHAAFAAA